MSSSDDELVMRYLARLNAAASEMPADRRHELIDEITTHIEEAMAATPAPPGGISTVLDQLGSPEEIVRAAGAALPGETSGQPGSQLGAVEIVAILGLLIGGIVVPLVGWLVGVVLLWISPRWKVGDKLLATLVWPGGLLAPLFAFLVLGAGAVFTVGSACTQNPEVSGITVSGRTVTIPQHASGVTCTAPPVPPWLAITLAIVVMIAALGGPILVAIRLLRQARRPAALPEESDPDLLTAPLPV